MSHKDHLEQWVCLLREGDYGATGTITSEALTAMASNFTGPMPVWPNASCLGPPETMPPMMSRCEIVAVEFRQDERGGFLAGLVKSPDICVSFVNRARNRETGASIGPMIRDAIFTDKKLQPK